MFFKCSLLNKELKKASSVSYFKKLLHIYKKSLYLGRQTPLVIYIFQNVLVILALFFQTAFKITQSILFPPPPALQR